MRGRAWLYRALMLWVVAGCSHGSSATRREPFEYWIAEDTGVRTKGGDSVTPRISILIARGQLQEAQELLTHALAAGLVTEATAMQLREQIQQGKERHNSEPHRIPPPIGSEDLEPLDPSRQRSTCSTEMPDHPLCRALPDEYTFHSACQALEAMKLKLGQKSLALHGEELAEQGPCPDIGRHYNVRVNGRRAGSITCCPCCVDTESGPLMWTKCRIVW